MAGQQPERKYYPIRFAGVLDEASTPSQVGGSGLTACENLVYRRYGAWGKRAGSTYVYAATIPKPYQAPAPTSSNFGPAPPTPPNPPPSPPGTPKPTPNPKNPGKPVF